MAEWLKAHDSKSCDGLRRSKVRILSLPPSSLTIFLLCHVRLFESAKNSYFMLKTLTERILSMIEENLIVTVSLTFMYFVVRWFIRGGYVAQQRNCLFICYGLCNSSQ